LKNSYPFGKKCQKTAGGIFFDSHCIVLTYFHSASADWRVCFFLAFFRTVQCIFDRLY